MKKKIKRTRTKWRNWFKFESDDKSFLGKKKKRAITYIDSNKKYNKSKKKKSKNTNAEHELDLSNLDESDDKSDSEEISKNDSSCVEEDKEEKEVEEKEKKEYKRIREKFIQKYEIDLDQITKYNLLFDDYEEVLEKEDLENFYSIYDMLTKRCKFKKKWKGEILTFISLFYL